MHADPLGLPEDAPGSHGINDDRMIAFMRGYLDGVTSCGLPLSSGPLLPDSPPPGPEDGNSAPDPGPSDRHAPDLVLSDIVPSMLELPQGQPVRVESQGTSTFDDMVSSFPDPVEARDLLLAWGWQENVYRIYASDNPPPDAAGWVALGIHRFDSVNGAAEALPYFAAARRNTLEYDPVDVGHFADQTEATTGRAVNGQELVIYARLGNLIFRVDGIAPNGDPAAASQCTSDAAKCKPDALCNSKCGPAFPSDNGYTLCQGSCIQLGTNDHCSDCTVCSTDLTCCSGTCVDMRNDVNHCGSCPNACTGGKTCQNADCQDVHAAASLHHAFPPTEARRIAARIEWHYTPTHGSWLNMAELELSGLTRQCPRRRIPDRTTLATELAAWVAARNATCTPITWRFTTEVARIRRAHVFPVR